MFRLPASVGNNDGILCDSGFPAVPAYNSRDAQGNVVPQEGSLQSGDGYYPAPYSGFSRQLYRDGACPPLALKCTIEGTLPTCTTPDLPISSFSWSQFAEYTAPMYVVRMPSPSNWPGPSPGLPRTLPSLTAQLPQRFWLEHAWGSNPGPGQMAFTYSILAYKMIAGRRLFAEAVVPFLGVSNTSGFVSSTSTYWNTATAAMASTTLPNPNNLSASALKAATPLTLRWTPPIDTSTSGFVVLCSDGTGIDTQSGSTTSVTDDGSWPAQTTLQLPQNLVNPELANYDRLPWRGLASYYQSWFNYLTFNRDPKGMPPYSCDGSYLSLAVPATIGASQSPTGWSYADHWYGYAVWTYKTVGGMTFFAPSYAQYVHPTTTASGGGPITVSWAAVSGADGYFVTRQTYTDNSGYRGALVADTTPSGYHTTGTSIIDDGSLPFADTAATPGLLANRALAWPCFTITVWDAFPADDKCLVVGRLCAAGNAPNIPALGPQVIWQKVLDHRMINQADPSGLVLDYFDQYPCCPPAAAFASYGTNFGGGLAPPADDWSGTWLHVSRTA
jgi:hypothetical protein